MTEPEWIDVAMSDDSLVIDVLFQLSRGAPPPEKSAPPPLPPSEKSAPALQLDWSVRQRRTKHVPKKKGESARDSPTTPLSWSGGTSVSGGVAEGVEESSQLSKQIEAARSKVAGTSETTTSHNKRSRKKKTLAELKEEENLLLKERKDLKNQLEKLRLTIEQERATNERLKRRKLNILSHQAMETMRSTPASHDDVPNQSMEVGCNPLSSILPVNDVCPSALNPSSKVHENESKPSSFALPDLNLPLEDDSGCLELYGTS